MKWIFGGLASMAAMLTLDGYASAEYVANDPINKVDPTGMYHEIIWTSPTTVEVYVPVYVDDPQGIGSYTTQDLANQISKDFSGTTQIGGTQVTVTTTGVPILVPPGTTAVYNTNVQTVDPNVPHSGETGIIGGETSTVGPQSPVVNGSHEVGHNIGGTDRYTAKTGPNGQRVTTADPGHSNTIMGDLRGPAHPDTLAEIVSSADVETCSQGVSAPTGGC